MTSLLLTLLVASNIIAAELPDCGKLGSALIEFDFSKNTAIVDDYSTFNEEFCDKGLNEINANFEITLLNKDKKIVNKKTFFVNPIVILEGSESKKEFVFGKTKLSDKPQYRSLQFAISKNEEPVNFKIISLKDKKVFGEGVLK